MSKETHARNIIDSISDYFPTQRVKVKQDDYAERLAKHHAVILAAMKARQKADASTTDALQSAVEAVAPCYPKHEH